MLSPRSRKHSVLSAFAALALLLRVAIPSGFMPSSVSDGWFLQLCPDGLPTHVMVALFGEHHFHRGSDSDTFFQCDYDSGVIGDVLLDASVSPCSVAGGISAVATRIESRNHGKPTLGFLSRAPPHYSRLT